MVVAKKAFHLYHIIIDYTNDKSKTCQRCDTNVIYKFLLKRCVSNISRHCFDTKTIQSYHESGIYPSTFTNVSF